MFVWSQKNIGIDRKKDALSFGIRYYYVNSWRSWWILHNTEKYEKVTVP